MAPAPLGHHRRLTTSSAVTWDSGRMHPSPLASHPFVLPAPSFTDLDIPKELQYQPRPKSALNWTGTRTSYLGGDLHDTVRRGEGIRRRRSRDDVRALIEFLRNHEPPPDNFMSTPYDNDDDERGRWSKIRDMAKRRSKSMPRAPPPMRLPDSAVSGTTIGGHKHIAISIPLQASPFGERPRSQYPIYQDSEPVPPLPKGPIRTYMNERGVVTVLNPWAEGNEPRTPTTPTSPYGHPAKGAPPLPLSERKIMTAPQLSRPPVPPPKGNHAAKQGNAQAAIAEQTASNSVQDETNGLPLRPSTAGSASKHTEFRRAEYPSRGSSMAANPRSPHHPSTSIDGIIAEEKPSVSGRIPSPVPEPGAHLRRAADRRPGTREKPPVSLATSMARRSASNLRGEFQYEKERSNRQSKTTLISQNPVVANQDEPQPRPSPPSTAVQKKSRKDKVREKKLRDMETARSSKLSLLLNDEKDGIDNKTSEEAIEQPAPTQKHTSQPSLCPIMVVVDVKPDTPTEDPPPSPEPEQIPRSPEPLAVQRTEAGKADALVYAGNPTPPASTDNSPAQKFGFDTRTSLTRRREWNANREQERKKREASAVARAKLQQLAAAGAYGGGMDTVTPDPEQEILRLYEAYREHRLRDMERRVRRLERNGDVWLRALLPVLENMNQKGIEAGVNASNLARDAGEKDLDSRDCASDDEGTAERTCRVSERKRHLARRASLSQGRMLEELMRQEKQRDARDSQVEDASGMGSIEPLMRELATGGSKFGKAGMRGGAVHVA